MIMLKKALKPCFRQYQPRVRFLTAQQYAAVVSPEGGTGTTANTTAVCLQLGKKVGVPLALPADRSISELSPDLLP